MRSYFGRCMGVVLAIALAAMFLQPNTHTAFAGTPPPPTYTLTKQVALNPTCAAVTTANIGTYTFTSSVSAVTGQCVVVRLFVMPTATLSSLTLTDTLPTGLTGQGTTCVYPSASTYTCTVASTGLTFTSGTGYSLPTAGGPEAFVAQVNGTACGALTNTATASNVMSGSTSIANQSKSATINVTCPLTKTVSCTGGTVTGNGTGTVGVSLSGAATTSCTYTLTATAATTVSVADNNFTSPGVFTFNGGLTTPTCTAVGGGAVSGCTISNGTATYTYHTVYNCTDAGDNTNTASLYTGTAVTGTAIATAAATVTITCPTVTTPTITKTVACTGGTVSGTNTNTTVGLTTGTGFTTCTYTITVNGLASGCAVVQDPITGHVFNVGIVCTGGATVTGTTLPIKTTQPATFTFQQTYGPFTNCGTAVVQNVADLLNTSGTATLATSNTVNVTLNVTGCGTVTPPTAVPVIVCGIFQPVTGVSTSIMIGSTMYSIPGGMASLGVVVTPGVNVCFLVIGNTVVGVLTNILTSAHQVTFHYSWKALHHAFHFKHLWRMLAVGK
jgi:hypothetical protein